MNNTPTQQTKVNECDIENVIFVNKNKIIGKNNKNKRRFLFFYNMSCHKKNLFGGMYVYVCMYVCMLYVCMYVCIYACMYVCI